MKAFFIIIGVVVVLLFGGIAFFVLNINSVVKGGIEMAGPEVLKVAIEVDDVSISIFDGTGTIKGLRVANPEGFETPYAISVDEISIEVDTASLGSDVVHIRRLLLDGPLITYEGGLSDSNLKQLQESASASIPAGESTTDETATTPLVRIDQLLMRNAQVDVDLDFLNKTESLTLDEFELNDVGSDGESVAEVTRQILSGLTSAIAPMIRDRAGSNVTDKIKEKGAKLGEKLKGLFK